MSSVEFFVGDTVRIINTTKMIPCSNMQDLSNKIGRIFKTGYPAVIESELYFRIHLIIEDEYCFNLFQLECLELIYRPSMEELLTDPDKFIKQHALANFKLGEKHGIFYR